MGASWRRGSAAALLLVLAAALAPSPALAGTASDPEVTDPAGDQEIETGSVPTVLGVNDDPFDDIDLVSAYVSEFGPVTRITVATTAGWSSGTMALTFSLARGPTSLPASTATGTAFTVNVTGTTVTGVANATAATTAEGLRIDLPTANLGAVGGDILADLTLATSRTDPGLLQDVDQDDQTGTDTAGPGRAYTFTRPPVAGHIRIAVVGGTVDGTPFTGSTFTGRFAEPAAVRLELTNDGLDADQVEVTVSRVGPSPVASNLTQPIPVAPGATVAVTAAIRLPAGDDLPPGDHTFTFTATSQLGASADADWVVQVPAGPAPPPEERDVKPAGLTFLTGPAEAVGFDGPFDSYAELAFLALIVLLALLAIFLLLALGRTTLAGEPAAEAPWPAGAPRAAGVAAGPAGIAETVRANEPQEAPPALFPRQDEASAADAEPEVDAAALAAAFAQEPVEGPRAQAALPTVPAGPGHRIRIEEVRHTPREPDVGQAVTTEVLLRNEGPTATLRIALSIDGKPTAERVVQVPSRATKAVELPWTAGAGDNRVRIQAFPA